VTALVPLLALWRRAQLWLLLDDPASSGSATYYASEYGGSVPAAQARDLLPYGQRGHTYVHAHSNGQQYSSTSDSDLNSHSACSGSALVQRVNCGTRFGYTDTQGKRWAGERPNSVGSWGYIGGVMTTTTAAIANTTDPFLYQSEHYWTASAQPGYVFTAPNGQYEVTLKFVETPLDGANIRKFDVRLQGVVVLSAYDISPTLAAGSSPPPKGLHY